MKVVIAGGHGKIAQHLERKLTQRGDTAVGLIRNPDHASDLTDIGAEPLVIDLEKASLTEVTDAVRGADAVVFAAGAGPGSGAARKESVDRDAAILLADAAEAAGVRRYVLVSSMGADTERADQSDDPVFAAYLRAKADADANVSARDAIDATIIRPGKLTDDAGTGRVKIADSTGYGEIPREDVAAVIVAALDNAAAAGRTVELIGGDTPVAEAF